MNLMVSTKILLAPPHGIQARIAWKFSGDAMGDYSEAWRGLPKRTSIPNIGPYTLMA